MRLLDLFCGAGGAAMGYHRAGFDEIVGVDIAPQPRYPFTFVQGDAVEYLRVLVSSPRRIPFDAIHASPPCQAYSITRHSHDVQHPDLVPDVLDLIRKAGLPWVVENVVGAPLPNPLTLCGTMFGLEADDLDGTRLFLRRHRLFASNLLLMAPGPCRCSERKRRGLKVGGVYGGGSYERKTSQHAGRGGYTPKTDVRRVLMDMPWSTAHGVNQAIPPAYTEWLGRQLLA